MKNEDIGYIWKSRNITAPQKIQAEGYHGVMFHNAGDKRAYINESPCAPLKGLSFLDSNLNARDYSEYKITFEAGATETKVIMWYREKVEIKENC